MHILSGHVEKRYKSSWTIVIEQDNNGKRERFVKSFKVKTKKEAEAILSRLRTEMEQGTYVEPSEMTVSAYLDKWIGFMKDDWEHKTYKRNKGIIENYFKPELGNIKLGMLRPLRIQEHYK